MSRIVVMLFLLFSGFCTQQISAVTIGVTTLHTDGCDNSDESFKNINSSQSRAMGFLVGNSAPGIDQIRLYLVDGGNTPLPILGIYPDNGSNLPDTSGSALVTFGSFVPTLQGDSGDGIYTASCSSGCTAGVLSTNTRYWLVFKNSSSNGVYWIADNSTNPDAKSDISWPTGNGVFLPALDSGSGWGPASGQMLFAVDVVPVPESCVYATFLGFLALGFVIIHTRLSR